MASFTTELDASLSASMASFAIVTDPPAAIVASPEILLNIESFRLLNVIFLIVPGPSSKTKRSEFDKLADPKLVKDDISILIVAE